MKVAIPIEDEMLNYPTMSAEDVCEMNRGYEWKRIYVKPGASDLI